MLSFASTLVLLKAAAAIPYPQGESFGGPLPTCADVKTIPAGTEMKGVAGNQHDYYGPTVIIGPPSTKTGIVSATTTQTQSFNINLGVNFSPEAITGLQITAGLSWTTSAASGVTNSETCTEDECRLTFAAHLLTVNGGSYIDMDNSGTYDPKVDIGPDNDQSCKDRIFQAEYPLKFQSSGALDGRYDVCYTNGARDGKPACGDLQSLVT